jgi:hypothetical protein
MSSARHSVARVLAATDGAVRDEAFFETTPRRQVRQARQQRFFYFRRSARRCNLSSGFVSPDETLGALSALSARFVSEFETFVRFKIRAASERARLQTAKRLSPHPQRCTAHYDDLPLSLGKRAKRRCATCNVGEVKGSLPRNDDVG